MQGQELQTQRKELSTAVGQIREEIERATTVERELTSAVRQEVQELRGKVQRAQAVRDKEATAAVQGLREELQEIDRATTVERELTSAVRREVQELRGKVQRTQAVRDKEATAAVQGLREELHAEKDKNEKDKLATKALEQRVRQLQDQIQCLQAGRDSEAAAAIQREIRASTQSRVMPSAGASNPPRKKKTLRAYIARVRPA